ncbi:MAG: hypothetical protein HOV97_05175 [Nonomuraea sp.]|nr:hypothetical protein [Nonomuraea sp.]
MKIDIDQALQMLRDTELRAREIASHFHATPAALTHATRVATNLTPSEYRQAHGWFGTGQRPVSPRKVAQVLEFYDAGATLQEAASKSGVGRRLIPLILEAHGREIRSAWHYLELFGADQLDEIARRYKGGESTVRLAKVFGCSEHGIRCALDRRGVPRR